MNNENETKIENANDSQKENSAAAPINVWNNTSYVSGIRRFIVRNSPYDVSAKYERASPFLWASFIAWPTFWVYKGLNWPGVRGTQKITTYINKTYLQAKFLQLAIVVSGIMAVTYNQRKSEVLTLMSDNSTTDVENVEKQNKNESFDIDSNIASLI